MVQVRVQVADQVELTCKKHRSSHGSTHVCFGSKKGVWVGLGQKIPTHFSMYWRKKKFNKIFINMYVWVWMNHMNKRLKIIGWDRASWNSCHEFKIEKTNAFASRLRSGWFRSSLHPPKLWPNKNRVWQEGNWPNPNIQVLG